MKKVLLLILFIIYVNSLIAQKTALVKVGERHCFIAKNGKLLLKPHYIKDGEFYNELAEVHNGKKGNLIIKDKYLVIDKSSFYKTFEKQRVGFVNGLAKVGLNNKWNFINTKGEPLIKVWLTNISNFTN